MKIVEFTASNEGFTITDEAHTKAFFVPTYFVLTLFMHPFSIVS